MEAGKGGRELMQVLSKKLPARNEENDKNSQDSWLPSRDLNPVSPNYEARMLTTQQRRSVTQ
jgi:hypothetical protein